MADYSITAVDRRTVLSGSAGTGPYAFNFPVLTQTDLAVYKDDTKLSLTTDYTVSIGAAGTGTVTLGSAATGSNNITIVGARAIERTTDFVTAGDLLASSLNTELDSLTIFSQQVSEDADRAIKAPVTDPTSIDMTLPTKASRAGKTLAFDETTGNPVVGEEIGNYRGDWAASTAYSVRDLVKDTSTNNIFRCKTAHTSSGSQPLTSNTDSAKWDLIVDAASATTSATAAAASAASSASSATASASSATSAATAQAAAETAKTGAETAKTAAETAQAAAELAADNFDDTYLGAKASDPTVDNDGDALTAGDLYFNTSSNELKVYNGSAWQVAAVSTVGLLAASNNLSDVASAATSRTNLGASTVGANVFTAASAAAAQQAMDVEVGVDVQAFDADTAKTDAAQTFTAGQRGEITTLTDGATITPDMADSNNFVVTLGGNRTLANPSNLTAGQSGSIFIVQDGTGSRTLSFGSQYDFAGGTAPTLTTTASAVDRIDYVVRTTSSIHCVFTANYS